MADGDQLIIGNIGVGKNNGSDATTRLNRDGVQGNDAFVIQNSNGAAVYADGLTTPTAPRGIGVYGFARATGALTAAPGVRGESTNGTGVQGESQTNGFGVHGSSFGTGVRGESLADGAGVAGKSSSGPGVFATSDRGTGVRATSTSNYSPAVYARGDASAIIGSGGIWGHSNDGLGIYGTSGTSYGVATSSDTNKALYARSSAREAIKAETKSDTWAAIRATSELSPGIHGASTRSDGVVATSVLGSGLNAQSQEGSAVFAVSRRGQAAELLGNVEVVGRLKKTGGGFTIDHPLDPENKYLNHSFVESSEMKNVYDGVVELDENGTAWVELPQWFEELNRDFRYQLTPIGTAAPELHIAREISDNRFKVAGGPQGTKISWQVSGVRRDRWANSNRIEAEEEKPTEKRNRYLHPELYGHQEEQGIGWIGREEQLQTLSQRIEYEEFPEPPEELRQWIEEQDPEVPDS